MKNSDSSPTPNSNPPVLAAPDATRANLSLSPLSPASVKWRRRLDWLTRVRLLNATVVGGSAGALLGSLAGSFLGYPLPGALGVGLGALLFFWEKLGQAAHAFFTSAGPRRYPRRRSAAYGA